MTNKSISSTCRMSSFSSFKMHGAGASVELSSIRDNEVSMLEESGSQRNLIVRTS